MIEKRSIINFLFVASFPIYGLGSYVAATASPSVGYFISIFTHLFIVIFYCIDLLYKKEFYFRLNFVYVLMLLFQVSCIASLFVALLNDLPESNLRLTIGRSISLITPFHAFIVVGLYNERHREALPRLTLISLSILLAINLVAYFGLGWTNAFHSIEGRLSLPFFDGFYSGANVIAIINLLLLYYLRKHWSDPVRFLALAAYFAVNLVLFYSINSRLSTLIFLLVLLLMFFGLIRVQAVYILSLFTVPILLSSGKLLYKVLQLPVFVSLIQRVDIDDVTTFNGRAYLWQDAIDWLLYDQRGLVFGNGYKGHYFLDMIPDVVKLWNAENSHHLHLHSTSLETVVCQGLVSLALLFLLFYIVYRYYRRKYAEGTEEGAAFIVVVFLLFIMQVDTFVYLDSLGFVIFSLLMSKVAIREPVNAIDTSADFHLGEVTSGQLLTPNSIALNTDLKVNDLKNVLE